MKIGEYWTLHDDAALQRVDTAAVRLLERHGCRVDHEGLRERLRTAGCRVDTTSGRCFIPEALVRQATSHLRQADAVEAVELAPGWNPQRHLGHGGSFPHLLDWPAGERRLATRQDVIDMAKMAHVLEEFAGAGRVLTCAEVDPRIEPLWTTLAVAKTTTKPIGGGEIFAADYIEPLVRMGEVLTGRPGDTSLIASCDFFIAPLIFDRKQAECFLEKRRFGIANVPGTMPISGLSAPVTLAGTVTVAVAELLAGWVFGYVVCPGLPVSGIVSSGSLDMRTAAACFGSPEAMLQDMTTVQICRRLYGITVRAATTYVDCKRPGLEAVFQKLYPLVSAPFGTGLNVGGYGLLSAGQDYSPVQHLLDAEMASAVARFWGSFEISDATIAADQIAEVIGHPGSDFLRSEHTLRHFRAEQWYPRWFDRSLWQGQEQERDAEAAMLGRMDAYIKDAIRRYEPPELDRAKATELARIYAVAERRLVGCLQPGVSCG